MRRLIATVVVASSMLGACGGATTFGLRNGVTTRGYAVESDSATVTVQTSHGEIRTLNKCEIQSVAFPGRGAAVTGIVLAGIGAAILATGLSPNGDDPERSRALVIDSIPLLLAGGGLLGWGATTWSTSSSRIGALPPEPCDDVETPSGGPHPDVVPTDSGTGKPVPFPKRGDKERPFEPDELGDPDYDADDDADDPYAAAPLAPATRDAATTEPAESAPTEPSEPSETVPTEPAESPTHPTREAPKTPAEPEPAAEPETPVAI